MTTGEVFGWAWSLIMAIPLWLAVPLFVYCAFKLYQVIRVRRGGGAR